ncbi:hypothetical protein ACFPGO_04170 [Arcanobacterium canis]|uniref:Uncharacterized protein n=1 Tax=Arcanobacterium canis TaxID=999183 RepID=A0ABY8G210_9ACTO|nr:hypothetical protein [Arcanobacterium canis]WFM84001.1 hypothetical protein P7079_03240 [Arcanobacterium canis]
MAALFDPVNSNETYSAPTNKWTEDSRIDTSKQKVLLKTLWNGFPSDAGNIQKLSGSQMSSSIPQLNTLSGRLWIDMTGFWMGEGMAVSKRNLIRPLKVSKKRSLPRTNS